MDKYLKVDKSYIYAGEAVDCYGRVVTYATQGKLEKKLKDFNLPERFIRELNMKRKIIRTRKNLLLLLFILSTLIMTSSLTAETLMLSFSGGYLFPADSGYREVYGNKVIVPEFKVGIRLYKDFYLYSSFFYASKKGLTPDLHESASSRQQFFSGGLACFPYLNKHFKAYLGAGVVAVTYREEAMEIMVSGNKLTFSVEGGLYLKEKFLLLGINAAYCAASASYEEENFKIGGTRAALLLGFVF